MSAGTFKITKRHTFIQSTPSTIWTIPHNMGGYAVVDVYITIDGHVQKILPSVTNTVNFNTTELTFSTPQAGFAQLVV